MLALLVRDNRQSILPVQDLDHFRKEVFLMSRVAHPNVVRLLAARVLPPGCLRHMHSVQCFLFFPALCVMHCLWTNVLHGDMHCCGAEYMLVMPLEGDNLATKLHQQV